MGGQSSGRDMRKGPGRGDGRRGSGQPASNLNSVSTDPSTAQQVTNGLNSECWETYESTSLSSEVTNVAAKELREDETTRQQALRQFTDWIRKNRDLDNCRTDPYFLLRFLRAKKFSVPMAQTTLLKYLNLRQTFPDYFHNLDYLQPSLLELINSGYLFPSPVRDSQGRRVIIGIAENFDPYKYTCHDMAKVHALTYETLLEDEENQILGFTHVGDFKGLSTSHVTLWSPSDFATIFKWGEHSVPMRHKMVHLLNLPGPLRYVVDFARSRLTQKIKDRTQFHDSLEELHNSVDRNVLPKEYGGDIPMAEMIELWKKELSEKRSRLLQLDTMRLLDNSCILKKNQSKSNLLNDISVAGSFRKLEVD